ncbi:ATP-binding protein [Thiovibrio sp. JS02]
MTEPTFETIFEDLVDVGEELQGFLSMVEKVLPEAALLMQGAAGVVLAGKKNLDLSLPVREKLVERARHAPAIVSGKTDDGFCCYARQIPSLDAVLIFSFPEGAQDLTAVPGGSALLRNSLELALVRQEQEILVADKEQALTQITILKQQHGKLIEDNYRQYRLNQEREKEYAKKLESEIAKQTAELREANARLEEISRLKSDFLANMSHELRTPMNAIIGFTELLSETNLDCEQADYTKTIAQSASSLLSLINDILDLAKIESGKLELEHISFDLGEVVGNVCSLFKLPAKEKGVAILCSIDERIPRRVLGDSIRLRQVLVNLVGNAMKFTEQGQIDIRVAHERQVAGRILCRFSVRDTGIGIPADRREAIFDKFTQADGSTTRKYGGTGLGLAICLQLVGLMGGQLAVESEVGKGSTFFFMLPLEEAPAEVIPLKAPREGAAATHGKGGRILLVEDNAVNQRLATILIQREGYEVDVASDGVEAMERLKHQRFDLVLMDVQMPNMDGITATRKIREIEADAALKAQYVCLRDLLQPLVVIGLTAHARKEDENACYAAGMNGFLTKPIIKAKLAKVVSEMMPEHP